jgi:hypothetical protein
MRLKRASAEYISVWSHGWKDQREIERRMNDPSMLPKKLVIMSFSASDPFEGW